MNYQIKDGHKNKPNRVNQQGQPTQTNNPRRNKKRLMPRINLNPKQITKDKAKKWVIGLMGGGTVVGGGLTAWLLF